MHRVNRWACVVSLALAACGGRSAVTGTVEEFAMHSAAVGDDYRILVRLPPGYATDLAKRFPIVFQLDATVFGPEFDTMSEQASQLEEEGKIPEVIVVGVGWPYDGAALGERGRWRDFCLEYGDGTPAGANAFLQFLREELLPKVDANYRTDPSRGRALSGHSLGGYFSLYTMLETGLETDPPFTRFIAGDPSISNDDWTLLSESEALSARTTSLPRSLYLLIARYDGAAQRIDFDELTSRLEAHYPDLRLGTHVEPTDHGGAIAPSFRNELEFVFGGGR